MPALTQTQRTARHKALGGSDAAPALGLSLWTSSYDLFEEKIADAPVPNEDPKPWLIWGELIEPLLRQQYTAATGHPVTDVGDETFRHPGVDFPMVCHPDGLIATGEGVRLFEGKIDRHGHGWGEPGTDQIPLRYMVQCQHALAVLAAQPGSQPQDFRFADVAVLIGGSEFRTYVIPADPELQAMIIDGERDFWRCVETRTPPPVDYEAANAQAILRRMYPGTDGRRLRATTEQESWREVYVQAERWLKQYQQMTDGAKAHLLHGMGEAAELTFADGMTLRRQLVRRKGYTVPDTEFVDARWVKSKQ
jgi:predicted phage-related endonuclease